MSQQEILKLIKHHQQMVAYHSYEATQLLEKMGTGKTVPSRKGRGKLTQAEIDKIRAKVFND